MTCFITSHNVSGQENRKTTICSEKGEFTGSHIIPQRWWYHVSGTKLKCLNSEQRGVAEVILQMQNSVLMHSMLLTYHHALLTFNSSDIQKGCNMLIFNHFYTDSVYRLTQLWIGVIPLSASGVLRSKMLQCASNST